MTLYTKNGRGRLFWFKDLNTQVNLSEKYFYPESIKNDNGAVAMSNIFMQCRRSQQINQFKNWRRKDVEVLLNCALLFLFFILIKLREFRVVKNEIPKMVKKCASTNKLSQNFVEHVLNKFYFPIHELF